MTTTLRRAAALVAGTALAVSGLSGLTASPASADPSPASTSATTWLAGELTDGLFHYDAFGGYDDYGLSIDAGFAALSAGNTQVATTVRDAVAAHIDDYITGEAFDDLGSTYAGPTAKALAFAQASGGDPRSFGGVDLVTRLEGVTGADGRITDVSTFGDNANTIGQGFAVRALTTAGSGEAAAATSFLLKQQCPAGFFRLALDATPCATDADPDTDVTAFAVLNLQGQSGNPAVAAALGKANGWLLRTQGADGSFGGGNVTAAPNTNSTGLAAWALGESCQVSAAQKAAAYVKKFQVPAGQTGPLATEVGAVAYDQAALTTAQAEGITDATLDQFRRATAQAAPGLAWDGTAPATVTVAAPTGPVKGGTDATVTVSGASQGERVCVTDSTGRTTALTGTGKPLTLAVPTARKGGDVTVTATTGPGSSAATVRVLGKERFKVAVAGKVRPGVRVPVKVKGLAAGEKVKVLLDGKRVAKGKANQRGVFKVKVKTPRKPGKHKLKAVGQFANRLGVAAFRVVR